MRQLWIAAELRSRPLRISLSFWSAQFPLGAQQTLMAIANLLLFLLVLWKLNFRALRAGYGRKSMDVTCPELSSEEGGGGEDPVLGSNFFQCKMLIG